MVENPAKPEEKVVNTAQCPGNGGANKKIFEFLKEMRGISWAVVNPAKRNITSTANANVDGNSDISADKKPAPDISKAAKDRNAPLDPSKDRAGAIRKEF